MKYSKCSTRTRDTSFAMFSLDHLSSLSEGNSAGHNLSVRLEYIWNFIRGTQSTNVVQNCIRVELVKGGVLPFQLYVFHMNCFVDVISICSKFKAFSCWSRFFGNEVAWLKDLPGLSQGGLHHLLPKFEHICSCQNFPPLSFVQILLIPACCLLCVL